MLGLGILTQMFTPTRDEPNANVSADTSSEHDQIKAIVESFRRIHETLTENTLFQPINHYDLDTTTDPAVLTLHVFPDRKEPRKARSRDSCPADMPCDVQTAVLKTEGCDIAAYSFNQWISDALQTIGARVECLLIRPYPRLYIHYATDPLLVNMWHSVFSITSARGEEFIADFTIEQLGYYGRDWFTKQTEYFETRIEGDWRIASEDDMAKTEEEVLGYTSQTLFKDLVDAVCGEMHWPTCRSLPAADRLNWVTTRTQEVFDRVIQERYGSVAVRAASAQEM
jgi:hypothetical protein